MQQQLKHDAQGFLIGNGTVKASAEEGRMLLRIADDVRAMRRILKQRDSGGGRSDGRPAQSLKSAGSSAIGIATPRPRSSVSIGTNGSVARIAKTAEGRPVVALPRRSANDDAAKTLAKSISSEIRSRAGVQPADRRQPGVAVATPGSGASRDSMGRFVAASKLAPVTPRKVDGRSDGGRDGRGRFVGSDQDGQDDQSGIGGAMRKAIDALSDKVGGLANVASDAGEVDPSVKAASEVGDLASKALAGVKTVGSAAVAVAKPMGRGMAGLFGSKPSDAPTPWFRRFFAELRGLRREQSAFNKAELRVLKDIDGKDEGGKRGGMMGFLAMLLGPLISAIGAAFAAGFGVLSKLPGLGALAKLAGAMGPKALITQPAPGGVVPAAGGKPGALSRAGKGVGGLLKRVPLLGAALAAIGIGAGVYESETDSSLSRSEKDRKTGKAIGSGAGSIGGMFAGGAAGAKAGAMLGAMGGPVGVAIGAGIGSLVGGAAGAFFGDKAGDILSEKVGGWVTELRAADIPGRVISGWDKFTASLGSGFSVVLKKLGLDGVAEKAKQTYAEASLAAKRGYGEATGKAVPLNDAEAAVARRQFAQADPRRVDGGSGQSSGVLASAAQAVGSLAGKGAALIGGRSKAIETGKSYAAGNIAGLDEASTRALVASTALTESGGGKLDAVNKQGYMGRYQAGAAWLANAGLIAGGPQAVQAAMRADGFKSEWKWAEAGGMTRFLSNDANWTAGNSRAKYLASAEIQDQAFKANGDKTYADLTRRGVIKPGDSPLVVAGYLKAAHLAGAGGAVAVSQGKTGASDANGTSARKYFEDVAGDRHGFAGAFRSATSVAVPVVVSAAPAITPPPSPQVPKVQDLPSVDTAAGSASRRDDDKKPQVVVVGSNAPVGRDLADRRIAHIVTGGLSL